MFPNTKRMLLSPNTGAKHTIKKSTLAEKYSSSHRVCQIQTENHYISELHFIK